MSLSTSKWNFVTKAVFSEQDQGNNVIRSSNFCICVYACVLAHLFTAMQPGCLILGDLVCLIVCCQTLYSLVNGMWNTDLQ